MIKTNNGITSEVVDLFEVDLGFGLPSSYRDFLLKYNGGKANAVFACDVGEVIVDYMYGIGLQRNLDLRFWRSEFESEIVGNSLIIGADPGSGFYLMIVGVEDAGVYYYDQSYSFSESSDDVNAYLIENDISVFLLGLFS